MYAWPVPLLDGRTCKDHAYVDEDVEEAYTCVSSVAILERHAQLVNGTGSQRYRLNSWGSNHGYDLAYHGWSGWPLRPGPVHILPHAISLSYRTCWSNENIRAVIQITSEY